jgi:hypothetical protein
MPIDNLAGKFGISDPRELAFLKTIYDDLIAQQLAPSDRDALAAELLYLFKSGVQDREQLYKAALLPIKDRSDGDDLLPRWM